MTNEVELTIEAIAALQQGRFIDAVKLTRVANQSGLKEAKETVQAYLQSHPEIKMPTLELSQEAIFRLMVIMVGLVLVAWFYFK